MDNILKDYHINNEQLEKFKIYYEYLIQENEKINLTAITEEQEAYIKHFYDSLAMSKFIDLSNKTICDVGSGAGFPSIPLKILDSSIKVTIIEPTLKRINFLKNLLEKLNINDVVLINARAEDIINDYRDSFDICTARAVSNLPILLELTIPFIKINGLFLAYKGQAYNEELLEAQSAIKVLEVNVKDIYKYELPQGFGARALILFTKTKKTNPKYPRLYKEIKKKPL